MNSEINNHGGTETLLIVDDDKFVLSLLSDLLFDCGYTVITACNGEEAVETYIKVEENIHLVLMDVVMPRKDGITASSEIIAYDPDATIILMSGFVPDNQLELINIPCIKKPFSPTKTLKMIRNHLDGNFCEYEAC